MGSNPILSVQRISRIETRRVERQGKKQERNTRMKKTVNLLVNGVSVSVPRGSTVLQACEQGGVNVPRFCYHEQLRVAGNCRMCLVEREGSPKPVASCAMPAANGIKVYTSSPRVKKAREGVMERLLRNHPLDCPICDQGGECDLQDQARIYGSDRSRSVEAKRGVEDKQFGPLVKTVITRCIHCTRCVRFTSELGGRGDRGTTGRGSKTEIGTYVYRESLKMKRSGNRVDLCPVGALTSKVIAFRVRPWERSSVDTVDTLDPFRRPVRIQLRGGEIIRVRPKQRGELIGDKTRYARDGVSQQRRVEVYRDGEVVSLDQGRQTLKKRREENPSAWRRGSSVDLQRAGRRQQRDRKGVRKVGTRSPHLGRESRMHEEELGLTQGKRDQVLQDAEHVRRRGRDLDVERPHLQVLRRQHRVSSQSGKGIYAQWGGSDLGRGASGLPNSRSNPGRDWGKTRGSLTQRREGRHRRSGFRGNQPTGRMTRRRNETLRTRLHPRRRAWVKRRDRREEEKASVVNVIQSELNTTGRRARGLDQLDVHSNRGRRVGVDQAEREEHGRGSREDRGEDGKRTGIQGRRSSYASVPESGRDELRLRYPRKTSVEADHRRTSREGETVWTTGVAEFPQGKRSEGGRTSGEDRAWYWDGSERSDPRRVPHPRGSRRTTGSRSLEFMWKDRTRPMRYDYYREGHPVNRVSPVIAKTSAQNR